MRVWLLAALMATTSSPPLRVIVSPRLALAPSNVTVLVRLEPAPMDRYLGVSVDNGETYTRTSEQTLDGEVSPRLFRFEYRDLPAGEYDVRAVVGTRLATRAEARDRVLLKGPN